MPRYYFNIMRGDLRVTDQTGLELSDLGAAQAVALNDARALLSVGVMLGMDRRRTDAFEICDENGIELLTVSFSEALASS
ncbi:hypothetical protein [Aureimonas sp. ME7]|uniref:DUF6894 family protein n=1 Tax=Aureimonas sp. ME7 TaxID=2744252 RepID=UPI0015F7BF7E|nr:hypothetical protein [Aureimonas sp. ME7]